MEKNHIFNYRAPVVKDKWAKKMRRKYRFSLDLSTPKSRFVAVACTRTLTNTHEYTNTQAHKNALARLLVKTHDSRKKPSGRDMSFKK